MESDTEIPLNYIKETVQVTALEAITALFTSQQFEECLKNLEIAKQSNAISSNQAKVFQAGCWIHLKMKQNEAMKLLQEVIREEPANAFAHFEIGVNLYLNGVLLEAIHSFELSSNLHSALTESCFVYINYAKKVLQILTEAETVFNNGNYTGSIEILAMALLVDESNDSIQRIVRMKIDEFLLKIVKSLENKVMGPDENANSTVTKSNNDAEIEKLILDNQFDKAESMLPTEENSLTAQQWFLKGLLKYRFGKASQGVLYFNKALGMDPENEKAKRTKQKAEEIIQLMNDATEFMKAQRHRMAIETLTRALKIDPSNMRISQGIYFQRSACKYKMGHEESAFKDYLQFEALQKETGMVMDGMKLPEN